MKKLIIALALTAGFNAVAAVTVTQKNMVTVAQEKEYKKIKVSDVSKEAMDKIKAKYGTYTVKEAYKANDGDYKLVLSKDGIDTTATFTSAGDLIKIVS